MKRENWYFQVWSGVFEHRDRLGDARWEFDWCILRTTEEIRIPADRPEDERWGLIYGGKPVPLSKIAKETHAPRRTVERHFKILREGGYIYTANRGRHGLQIAVAKSKKWPGLRKGPKPVPFQTIQQVLDDRWGLDVTTAKNGGDNGLPPPIMAAITANNGGGDPKEPVVTPDTAEGCGDEKNPLKIRIDNLKENIKFSSETATREEAKAKNLDHIKATCSLGQKAASAEANRKYLEIVHSFQKKLISEKEMNRQLDALLPAKFQ